MSSQFHIYRELDYARVTSEEELLAWAEAAFNFAIDRSSTSSPSWQIFVHVGRSNIACTVLEKNTAKKTDEMSAVLEGPEGWKELFGFPLHKEFNTWIKFRVQTT